MWSWGCWVTWICSVSFRLFFLILVFPKLVMFFFFKWAFFWRLVPSSSWPVGVPSRPAALWWYGLMQVCGRFAALSRIPLFCCISHAQTAQPQKPPLCMAPCDQMTRTHLLWWSKNVVRYVAQNRPISKETSNKKNKPTWLYTQMDQTKKSECFGGALGCCLCYTEVAIIGFALNHKLSKKKNLFFFFVGQHSFLLQNVFHAFQEFLPSSMQPGKVDTSLPLFGATKSFCSQCFPSLSCLTGVGTCAFFLHFSMCTLGLNSLPTYPHCLSRWERKKKLWQRYGHTRKEDLQKKGAPATPRKNSRNHTITKNRTDKPCWHSSVHVLGEGGQLNGLAIFSWGQPASCVCRSNFCDKINMCFFYTMYISVSKFIGFGKRIYTYNYFYTNLFFYFNIFFFCTN